MVSMPTSPVALAFADIAERTVQILAAPQTIMDEPQQELYTLTDEATQDTTGQEEATDHERED